MESDTQLPKVSETDVPDLVQRTFAGCVEGAHRFRGEGSFSAYVLSIARKQQLAAPEIAQVLEIQPGAVRVRLHRARAALREALGELVGPQSESEDLDSDAVAHAHALGRQV